MAPKTAAPAKTGKPAKPKKSKKGLYIWLGIIVVGGILYLGFQPLTGTIKFGICRVYAEQTLIYPPTLRIISAEERPQDVRIEYGSLNEFGESVVKRITCNFRPDGTNLLSSVDINGQKQSARTVAIFNTTIPFIIANPPSLVLPPPVPVELVDLQR